MSLALELAPAQRRASEIYFVERMPAPSRLLYLPVPDLLAEAAVPASGLTSLGIGAASPEDVVLSAFGLAIY